MCSHPLSLYVKKKTQISSAFKHAAKQLNWSPLIISPTLFVFFIVCHQCKCWPGFHLKDDGKTCVDVDECSTTLPCSQRCINTYGSYKCLCVDGYEALERNPNTCKALSGQPIFDLSTCRISVHNCESYESSDAACPSFQPKSLFSLWRTITRSASWVWMAQIIPSWNR